MFIARRETRVRGFVSLVLLTTGLIVLTYLLTYLFHDVGTRIAYLLCHHYLRNSFLY